MVDPDEPADPVAPVREEMHGDRHGHRPADERDVPQVEGGENVAEVVGVGRERVAIRRLARVAGPAKIERDDPMVDRQAVDLALPEAGRDRPAGNEEDARPGAMLLVVERQAV